MAAAESFESGDSEGYDHPPFRELGWVGLGLNWVEDSSRGLAFPHALDSGCEGPRSQWKPE